jgi:hypothetical protein
VNILLKNQSVSVNLQVNNASSKYDKKVSDETFFPIAASVLDTGDAPYVVYIFANFRKTSKFRFKEIQGHGGR